ncbi:hypothetical protein SAMN06265346_108151 [Flavobacterium hercynium]|nr:hypothetical protein SAMN06265346_108151 [Flavobacterium hercynium]
MKLRIKVLNAGSSCKGLCVMLIENKIPSKDLSNSICSSKSINLEK